MKFCSNCGYKLTRGKEKFCSECGNKLEEKGAEQPERHSSIKIKDTGGDMFGVGFTGSGNILGKELDFTIQRNVFIFSGDASKEVIENLQKIINVSTRVEQPALTRGSIPNKEDSKIKAELEESSYAQRQIRSVLEDVKKIERKHGAEIQVIQAEEAKDILISKNDLLMKEYLFKGNEHLEEKEYSKAMKCYDKALEIDPKYADAWSNKGAVLIVSRKHEEAIECYDKALEIDPKDADAWNGKGFALYGLGKYEEAIRCFEKALVTDPKYANAWSGKGLALSALGKIEEAIECYDKALEIDPKYEAALVWDTKGVLFTKLGKHEEAVKCFDKAIEIDPNFTSARNKKDILLKHEKKKRWFR